MLKLLALDFDGTIVDSNDIKDSAFEEIFSDWPEYKDTMMNWHLTHNHVDRREKFRFFIFDVLGLPGREDLVDDLTSRFEHLTRQAIINCPFVPGAQEFLEFVHRIYPTYLVSATPQIELKHIVKAKGLEHYFRETFGAPIDKTVILSEIMALHDAKVQETLFIGDSQEDFNSASQLGVEFIARRSDRKLDQSICIAFTNFSEILTFFRARFSVSNSV